MSKIISFNKKTNQFEAHYENGLYQATFNNLNFNRKERWTTLFLIRVWKFSRAVSESSKGLEMERLVKSTRLKRRRTVPSTQPKLKERLRTQST